MTASTDDATRNGSMPMSINRVNALGASFVCRVEKHQMAGQRRADGDFRRLRSRISPTITTFGSWRKMWRKPIAKVSPMSERTAIWLMPFNSYSTGSSIVMMRFVTELMELKNA